MEAGLHVEGGDDTLSEADPTVLLAGTLVSSDEAGGSETDDGAEDSLHLLCYKLIIIINLSL